MKRGLLVVCLTARGLLGQTGSADTGAGADTAGVLPVAPQAQQRAVTPSAGGVAWAALIREELAFLTVEHLFRLATEPGTRSGGIGLGAGYSRAVGNLHGWADGDPFYVNYIGHPIQGSVAGFLWQQNDRKYRNVEFGSDPAYWKAKMHAMAFAWAQSVQFEIGPLSEASIGHIQAVYPQQGFVDHVVTPVIGLGWQLAEDSMDKYVIRPLESSTQNVYLRAGLRMGLNPSRSFATLLAMRAPWRWESRSELTRTLPRVDRSDRRAVPARSFTTFEFAAMPRVESYMGSTGGLCLGGDGEASFRMTRELMLVARVGGCKFQDVREGWGGDTLRYVFGPRWTPMPDRRWNPFVQLLSGGMKLTETEQLTDKAKRGSDPRSEDTSGFTFLMASGLDLNIAPALAVRVANLEYARSFAGEVRGQMCRHSVQFTAGVVLRVGTW